MRKISTNMPRRGYGVGFEKLAHKTDMREFIDWWNSRSFNPVGEARDRSA